MVINKMNANDVNYRAGQIQLQGNVNNFVDVNQNTYYMYSDGHVRDNS